MKRAVHHTFAGALLIASFHVWLTHECMNFSLDNPAMEWSEFLLNMWTVRHSPLTGMVYRLPIEFLGPYTQDVVRPSEKVTECMFFWFNRVPRPSNMTSDGNNRTWTTCPATTAPVKNSSIPALHTVLKINATCTFLPCMRSNNALHPLIQTFLQKNLEIV